MSSYRKIDVRLWGDEAVRRLSRPQPNGQTLFVFLLTGPFTTNIPGLFSAGEAAMSERLGWELKDFQEVFREVLGEASGKGCLKPLAKYDREAFVVWIPNAIHYNIPENPNVIRGWKKTWDEVPECDLKHECYQRFVSVLGEVSEKYRKAFEETCGKTSRKSSRKTSPKQEQEQEQDSLSSLPLSSSSKLVSSKSKELREEDREQFIEITRRWNEIPGVKKVVGENADLVKRVLAYAGDHKGFDWWDTLFARVKQSDFLCGRKTDFQVTLWWVLGPKNLKKVQLGEYDNRSIGTTPMRLVAGDYDDIVER